MVFYPLRLWIIRTSVGILQAAHVRSDISDPRYNLRSNILTHYYLSLGLKSGGTGSSSGPGTTHHYTFHGDPHATFASFFGGSNPFDIFFGSGRHWNASNGAGDHDMDIDMDGDDDPFSSFSHFGFNGLNGFHRGVGRRPRNEPLHSSSARRKVQDPPVVHELRVSLEEIFHGCTKRMRITRRRLNPDGRTTRTEDKILNIVIKRGWKEGTKITFPKEGDETPENVPADIVFVLKDKGHPHFKRDGSNIIYTAKVSLKEVCAFFFFTFLQMYLKVTLMQFPWGLPYIHQKVFLFFWAMLQMVLVQARQISALVECKPVKGLRKRRTLGGLSRTLLDIIITLFPARWNFRQKWSAKWDLNQNLLKYELIVSNAVCN